MDKSASGYLTQLITFVRDKVDDTFFISRWSIDQSATVENETIVNLPVWLVNMSLWNVESVAYVVNYDK